MNDIKELFLRSDTDGTVFDTPAYKTAQGEITYGKLLSDIEYCGDLISRQGAAPVLVFCSKTIEAYTAVLACLYAGRAYIPIEPGMPSERLRRIIRSSKCSLAIGEGIKTDGNIFGIECVGLGELKRYRRRRPKQFEGDTAYIIYTSGSTGEPKGVPISRDNLLNFINWINRIDGADELRKAKIRVLDQASFSFDLSVADIYFAFSNRLTLVAAPKETMNTEAVLETVRAERIGMLTVTPTFLKLCMTDPHFAAGGFPALRCAFLCGERLETEVARKMLSRFPDCRLINAYGPTEATCAVSAVPITEDMLSKELLPVGRTDTSAVSVSIEDEEIVLRGKSVFAGYIGGNEGGFFTENGINCFRTGDIGYTEDGYIYCCGRKDSQVKYKGYRIELGDIENNLLSIRGVTDCAVVAKYRGGCVGYIKAFVKLEEGLTAEKVRLSLSEKLPLYMIPKVVEEIDSIPVNANGKTDRRRLAEL